MYQERVYALVVLSTEAEASKLDYDTIIKISEKQKTENFCFCNFHTLLVLKIII